MGGGDRRAGNDSEHASGQSRESGGKRGRGRGYAGIENELYFKDNTQMLFGDAKAGLQAVIAAVKELIN